MKTNYIVVHCTDSPNDRDSVDAETIHNWHLEKNWAGIGYHYIIKRDGTIEKGRPDYWKGAHAKAVNSQSLGICLVGADEFTEKQMESLENLIHSLKEKYPSAKVIGHCDVEPNKTCPNFDVGAWWGGFNRG